MGFFQSVKTQMGTAGELLGFIWRRRWWLVPLIVVLLVIGTLIALASASAVLPFIYTLF
jgi:uncharacterized protein DUF5989